MVGFELKCCGGEKRTGVTRRGVICGDDEKRRDLMSRGLLCSRVWN
jgi:hypothetical protein